MRAVFKRDISVFISAAIVLFVVCINGNVCAHEAIIKEIDGINKAVTKEVLENGLVLLVKESTVTDLVYVEVTIKAGSALEGDYLGSGISHFLEHMVFKGTKTRGPGIISKEVQGLGGIINASTSHEITDFHITVPKQYLPQALNILKDMLSNAAFSDAEFVKEREVILKEMMLHNDEPQNKLGNCLYETVFQEHPYRFPIIGYPELFKRITSRDLKAYYERMYTPNRIVITIVGGIKGDEVGPLVRQEFADFRAPDYREISVSREPRQLMKRTVSLQGSVSSAYLALGFHSTSVFDDDLFAMDVVSAILGKGNNSRLQTALLKKSRLVHSITTSNYTPIDKGVFVVEAILDRENIVHAEKMIAHEISRIAEGDLDNEELERAKKMIVSEFIFARETIEGQANDFASSQIMTGSYSFAERYLRGVKGVTRDDCVRAATKYLTEDAMTVATLLPAVKNDASNAEEEIAPQDTTVYKKIFPNGLRLLMHKDPKIPTVAIQVAFLGGVSVESQKNNGICGMVSRMLLKGTKIRGEDMIVGRVEARGGSISAFSGMNSFGFTMSLLKEDLEPDLEIAQDIVTNSDFPKEEFAKEKKILLSEIRDEDDDIFLRAQNLLRKGLYGDSPYGLRIIGEASSVSMLDRKDLINFYQTYCTPSNMVISIAGDIDMEKLEKKIGDLFGKTWQGVLPPIPKIEEVAIKHDFLTLSMSKEESVVFMGFKTGGVRDPDRYALNVLTADLSGFSGRLFANLRDKLSLAYRVGCQQRLGLDAGYVIFYIATTREKVDAAREALKTEIQKIQTELISDSELELVKSEMVTGYEASIQSNGFIAGQTSLDELYSLGCDTVYRFKDEITKVKAEDLQRLAKKYFTLNSFTEVVIAPPK